ncbi:hypothetical protein ASD65_03085 [Microbacterium sp. Root61]|uniref:hypothetical protein n=1 Tax=Microbacterium sp. Root61 TaxID=1736570 RepID=UPI0006FBD7E6|nr:hypothetical protein [Microbacterium sp. Root61]KRA23517.1 hypothetical protein ASD65_03085 [Microbacterium sp. Root61]
MKLTNDSAKALERLARTADQMKLGREVLRRQVIEARGAGASWESIGRMLGVTKQTAAKVYGPRVPTARVSQPVGLW